MEGVRVVDLGFWVAGPSAAGILADWGAEVIKIEPPHGDPFRQLFSQAAGLESSFNPPFELDNRGKRSIVVNYAEAEGRDIALRIIDRADVFITNLRPAALVRAGLDYESLAQRNPRLVYASVTGYGLDGPDRDRAAFDIGAFWSRSGIAASLTPAGTAPPYQRAGMGDHVAGIAAAAGVCAGTRAGCGVGRTRPARAPAPPTRSTAAIAATARRARRGRGGATTGTITPPLVGGVEAGAAARVPGMGGGGGKTLSRISAALPAEMPSAR